MSRSLMLLTEDALALDQLIDEYANAHGGDITDVDATITAWAGEITSATAAKVDAIAGLLREWRARAKARREQAQAIADAARADEARADRLSAYVLEAMRAAGRDKLRGDTAVLAAQKNGGRAPLDLREDELADAWWVVRREPDVARIREALEAGEGVTGARLGERGVSLRVR